MPKTGQTGVVIPVPAAETVLRSVAERHPGATREGVPAHVSVLYPFLPADEVDGDVTGVLSELFGRRSPLSVTFSECQRRSGFVYLHPDPADGLAGLISEPQRYWPDVVPYEGRYEVVEPHLTIAMHVSEKTATVIEDLVTTKLPISERLREAWLVVFDGQWSVRQRFPFGG